MTPLLTVAEVAERLRISRTTVYQLIEAGKLVAHRIGVGRGALRVSEADLADFIDQSRDERTPTQQAPKPPTRRLRHLRF